MAWVAKAPSVSEQTSQAARILVRAAQYGTEDDLKQARGEVKARFPDVNLSVVKSGDDVVVTDHKGDLPGKAVGAHRVKVYRKRSNV